MVDRNARLESVAANLASAVYSIVLRHGIRGSWIQMEVGLWKVLTDTIQKWAREKPPDGARNEFKRWREGLLVDLTESAFYIVEKYKIQGAPLEVELALYRAFRGVIRHVGQKALR